MGADPIYATFINGAKTPKWTNTRILGARLRPMSLWHRFVLNALSSPFVCNGVVQLKDFRVALAVFKLGYGDSFTRKPLLQPFLIHCRALAGALWWRFIRRKPQPTPTYMQRVLEKLRDQLADYAEDYLQEPEFGIIPRPTQPNADPQTPRGRAPAELEHVWILMRAGFSERRAWEMPIGIANWYRAMAIRDSGADLSFVDEEEKRWQEQLPPEYRHN